MIELPDDFWASVQYYLKFIRAARGKLNDTQLNIIRNKNEIIIKAICT